MMRSAIGVGLVLALTAGWSLTARAAQPPKEVAVKKVRVGFPVGGLDEDGFPAGDEEGKFKSGFWTPVYVKLEIGLNPIAPNQYAIVVESADVDDVNNHYVVPLTAHTAGERFTVLALTKPGSSFADITVSVQEYAKGDGTKPAQLGRTIDTFSSDGSFHSIQIGNSLYLVLGSAKVYGRLKESLAPPGEPVVTNVQLASVHDVQQMPAQWFAYAPVDLLILCTGDKTFIDKLVSDRDRWSAIAEWVRRGGHLVISAGQNQNLVADLDTQHSLLPMALTAEKVALPEPADALAPGLHTLNWKNKTQFNLQRVDREGKAEPIYVVKLEPKLDGEKGGKARFPRESEWLVPREPKGGPAVIVRGTYGLGQVTLVTLDLEQVPFKEGDKASETAFWKNFREDLGGERAVVNQNEQFGIAGPGWGTVSNDLATKLQQNLEYFEDIPVIGFGWVALFILLYILVVGPLDYFFLKKVVKRLELTWITFPAVVIFISVVAYFVAYWIKGDKLKMNKVDVVDIDLHNEQVYGNTWFTLFSPRIEHYTIGIEPAPDWPPGGAKDYSPVVSWMDRPETNPYGSGRSRGQSLFHRAYDYEPDAVGLRGVPIQVWSMKSFTASWEVPTQGRLVTHKIHRLADNPTWIGGTVTSHLPVDLEDVTVFYRQECYALGKLPRGDTEVRLGDVKLKKINLESWFSALSPGYNVNPFGQRRGSAEAHEPAEAIVRWLAFYDAAPPQGSRASLRNTSLRYLDQSWRMRHLQDEVILYGRVAARQGDAQTVAKDPASPSRLWLRDLPQTGHSWPELSGTLRQETFVRIYIPVAPAPQEAGPK
jgi:hypothetical protein